KKRCFLEKTALFGFKINNLSKRYYQNKSRISHIFIYNRVL
ncbi:MAG: hypothetical protein ACI9Y7_000554, partial [Dokdonia sp.]